MTEIDLDINNYNYNDLLNLFSIRSALDESSLHIMDEKLKKIKNNIPDYYVFFYKAYKIISCIYFLNKTISVNVMEINDIVNKITRINSFETYSPENIIGKIDISYLKKSTEMIDIKKPPVQEQIKSNSVVDSFPNVIAAGSLNSIKRLTYFLNLNLNTSFRNNYYNSNPCDFLYNIPTEIKNVVSLRLASIEIPNSWYLFSSQKKNNIFVIKINNNNVTTSYTITIPDGNYDNNMLETYLNDTYFYKSLTLTDLNNIKFSIDPYSFKSNFSLIATAPQNFYFTAIFFDINNNNENLMNTFGWIIGFRLAKYKNMQTITSEGLFDAGGDRYIYMSIEDYQYNNNSLNIVCFDKSIMEQNIISKIPMINGKLSMIIDNNSSPLNKTRKYNGPVNIRNLHIKILDCYGNVIDINNMDYSFTIELEILYEGFNFRNINR